MTAKRFIRNIIGQVYDTKNGKFFQEDYNGKPIEYEDDLVECLNALHEENEQLIYALNQRTEQCDKLHEENEHYKSRVEYLERKIQRERASATKQHLKWSKEAEEQIQILAEENEQLKQEKQLLYKNIDLLKRFIEKQGFKVKLDEKLFRVI